MSRKKFGDQFKVNSIEYALKNEHKSAREISQELGVGESTLSKWVAEHKKQPLDCSLWAYSTCLRHIK